MKNKTGRKEESEMNNNMSNRVFIVHFYFEQVVRLNGAPKVATNHEAHQYSGEEAMEVLPQEVTKFIDQLEVSETTTYFNVTLPNNNVRAYRLPLKAARVVIHRMF
jgi:hypothetical protein